MEPSQPEIILLNVFDNSKNRNVPFWRSSQLVAPLGLFCLQELAPKRVSVKSVPAEFSSEDFYGIDTSKVLAVVLQESSFFDEATVESYFKTLRSAFPGVSIGLAGQRAEFFARHFNFTVFGTGATAILRILRGMPVKGYIDTLEEDVKTKLPIPDRNCFHNFDFRSSVERTLSGKTLDISKPWMGMLDNSSIEFESFDEDWIKSLLAWLTRYGYKSFQFNYLGNNPEHIHLLRTLCWSIKVDFGVFVSDWEFVERIKTWPGNPLKQIWFSGDLSQFYKKNTFEQAKAIFDDIKKSGVESGIYLQPSFLMDPNSSRLLRLVNNISFTDSAKWNGSSMRNVSLHFWKSNWRFVKKLLSIKSAMELVDFMRLSYSILECIFFPMGGE